MHAQHFVANRLIAPDNGLRIKVFDPSNGEPFAEIARGALPISTSPVHAARQAADGAWGEKPRESSTGKRPASANSVRHAAAVSGVCRPESTAAQPAPSRMAQRLM
ncbi:hypothetical protein AWV80_11180 [Cupriavidus sp. UYMU48A]|nr:hypothetical protein AWV80_11180 [Cupriavidus sp. UYMU48A]